MQYENGKPYIFEDGTCVAKVTLENFSPEAVEQFNCTLVYEKVKAYKRKLQDETGT